MDIPLGNNDWKCFVTETVITKSASLDLASRAIICSKDNGKTIVSSTARCDGNKIDPKTISDFSELIIISNKISRDIKLLCN